MSAPLLSVNDLCVSFEYGPDAKQVLSDVSFEVRSGETVGIVGESGSGKTLTALAVLGLLPGAGHVTSGTMTFDGQSLTDLSTRDRRDLLGNDIAMIFQQPMTALDPVFSIGQQMVSVIRRHTELNRKQAYAHAADLLHKVRIASPKKRLTSYPHELSGGMRQRVMIAMALSCSPKLLLADEPTTALDVTTQAQVLELMQSLQQEFGMAIVFVTHDLGVVANICDRALVMYAGRMIERASVDELFNKPKHPYTQGLLKSVPRLDAAGGRLATIRGQVPSVYERSSACAFAERCDYKQAKCTQARPKLNDDTHTAACFFPLN